MLFLLFKACDLQYSNHEVHFQITECFSGRWERLE